MLGSAGLDTVWSGGLLSACMPNLPGGWRKRKVRVRADFGHSTVHTTHRCTAVGAIEIQLTQMQGRAGCETEELEGSLVDYSPTSTELDCVRYECSGYLLY